MNDIWIGRRNSLNKWRSIYEQYTKSHESSTSQLGQACQQPFLHQKVVLLSLAESEGPSDFTCDDPLLLMSRPCNRPRESVCRTSEREWESDGSNGWVDILDGEWPNGGICIFWRPVDPGCCCESWMKDDGAYAIWCIPKLNDSDGLIISPVAILSLSTSFFNASFKAA